MSVERYGSKMDVVVKLILVFFISLLSFSIGTFVGKKFSDNQHKLTKLEPGMGTEREIASVNPDATEVKPNESLNDEEIKKLAEEFVTEGETNPEGQANETQPDVKTDKAMPTADVAKAKSDVAQRVAAGQAPVDAKVEAPAANRVPQNLPKELAVSAAGKYTVQVAAYATEPEAQKVATDLKDKGFNAFYVSAVVKDKKDGTEKTWFRVSVGLFTTQKEADAYKTDLLARAKVASALVTKIAK